VYRLSDFDYALPPELIAQVPAPARTASRLLHVAGDALRDLAFADLPGLLAPGDLLVFNDTRVVRSRLHAAKPTGGHVELLLERVLGPHEGVFQLGASHPPHVGGTVVLPGGVIATAIERDGRFYRLAIDGPRTLLELLERHGEVPLPPYIARRPDASDEARYQTVYARHAGAVAAPTAGLHFDDALLGTLREAGIELAWLTLHVGAGTFAPLSGEDLAAQRMHSEWYRIAPETAGAVAAARARGGRVVAVGTTTLRALESAADGHGAIEAGEARTALFVTPGFRFRVVDRLLTNFHLPRSTLLVLVSAFAGCEVIRRAYRHAIEQRYRFFSYGDAMLLERAAPR
jgi:S-adenosylmethionine:tRNA ribosyltransferase-isomerase